MMSSDQSLHKISLPPISNVLSSTSQALVATHPSPPISQITPSLPRFFQLQSPPNTTIGLQQQQLVFAQQGYSYSYLNGPNTNFVPQLQTRTTVQAIPQIFYTMSGIPIQIALSGLQPSNSHFIHTIPAPAQVPQAVNQVRSGYPVSAGAFTLSTSLDSPLIQEPLRDSSHPKEKEAQASNTIGSDSIKKGKGKKVPFLRKYICNTCKKTFTTSGHLSRHTRIHTGEKKFTCSFKGCDAKFSRQDNCMQHYRTHFNNSRKRQRLRQDYTIIEVPMELKNSKHESNPIHSI